MLYVAQLSLRHMLPLNVFSLYYCVTRLRFSQHKWVSLKPFVALPHPSLSQRIAFNICSYFTPLSICIKTKPRGAEYLWPNPLHATVLWIPFNINQCSCTAAAKEERLALRSDTGAPDEWHARCTSKDEHLDPSERRRLAIHNPLPCLPNSFNGYSA